tara:strand:+ start:561 stop:971 length:411 start_codon:yes stop_codon:yes gene_type:complete
MTFHYGTVSQGRLNTCHPSLKELFVEAIHYRDIAILCGHRPEAEQNKAFADGYSTYAWADSDHNVLPSRAIDACPWPEPRPIYGFAGTPIIQLTDAFEFGGFILGLAATRSLKLVWGGHWREPFDPWHFQLAEQII